MRTRRRSTTGSVVEVVIWELAEPLPPSQHRYKYRLFYGWPGRDIVRYDNERGKGDHRHVDGKEQSYVFVTIEQLPDDFEYDMRKRGAL